jgi:Flp pilus assembly protein TadB
MSMSTNEKLEKTVREKPFLQHALDLRIVARAVAFAFVAMLVMWLLVGPASAGFMLLLVFFGSWFVLARVDYDRRRESEPVDEQGEGQPAGAG